LARTEEDVSPILSCPDCGLLQRRVALPRGARACCARCHAILYRENGLRLDVLLALNLAASLMFILANLFPMVTLQAGGAQSSTTLFGSVEALWAQEMQPVALVVLATTILVPALELFLLCYLLLPLYFNRAPTGFVPLMRLMQWVHPWGMTDVFLIGVLVALVKLARLAEVTPGVGLWSFCVLILLLTVNAGFFNSQRLWRHYRSLRL